MKVINLLAGFMLGVAVMAFTAFPQTEVTTGWLAAGIFFLIIVTGILNAIDYWEDKENSSRDADNRVVLARRSAQEMYDIIKRNENANP